MKKNININLCGRLFNIDEDAYELLKNYMDTLHNYFKGQIGGDEIADDIEQRIAELLDELKANGIVAINIDHIKNVINRIGQPEQMDNNEEKDHEEQAESASFVDEEYKERKGMDAIREFFRNKRFYRNPKDKMLAGVISGFASTFEIDVTILRLLVVAFAIFVGAFPFPFLGFVSFRALFLFIISYCIFAAIMPEAETPEQQLKMQGKPVNMSNLANEVVQSVSETTHKMKEGGYSGAKNVLNAILKFFTNCFKVILVILAIGLFFVGAIMVVWAILAFISPTTIPEFFDWDMMPIFSNHPGRFSVFLIALIMALLIPAYIIIYCLNHRMSAMQRITWLLIWLIALATSIMTGITLTQISDDYKHENRLRATTTIMNNIRMSKEDANYLQENGWEVVKSVGCDRFTACGQHYSGDAGERYLDDYNEHASMRCKIEQSETVEPGVYKLTAVVRSENQGPILYAKINGETKQIDFPITSNEWGSVWKDACEAYEKITKENKDTDEIPQMEEIENIRNANDGKGFGWTRIAIENIIVKNETTITYGISTNTPNMRAKWFSACDIELSRMDE